MLHCINDCAYCPLLSRLCKLLYSASHRLPLHCHVYKGITCMLWQVTSKDARILNKAELTKFQKVLRGAVGSVVPKGSKTSDGADVVDNYMEHYNCKPPPLFMIIISVVEVSSQRSFAMEDLLVRTPEVQCTVLSDVLLILVVLGIKPKYWVKILCRCISHCVVYHCIACLLPADSVYLLCSGAVRHW